MFHGKLMIRTNNGSLEQAPDVLHCVRVSDASHVLILFVINSNVDRVVIRDTLIALMLIGANVFRFFGKLCFDELAENFFGRGFLSDRKSYLAAALNRAENHSLVIKSRM